MSTATRPHGRRQRATLAPRAFGVAVLALASCAAGARAPLAPQLRDLPGDRSLLLQAQSRDIGESAAADAAARATGGKVLNVKRAGPDGAAVYYVKVLLGGGKLRIVKVNGQSGAVE